jgi:D-glycero-D-manno-heptose 1,7-bisphosphate phosphatase
VKKKALKKAVFLDRDGTVIIDKIYLNDPNGVEYFPRVFEAMQMLRDAGYVFVIVTNQSGVPRGLVQIENIDKIHHVMAKDAAKHDLKYAGFYYAPYSVESNHPMRKPNTGMLDAAARDLGIDLSQSWMIGDRMSDVEAGHRAGTKSILLKGVEETSPAEWRAPEYRCTDLYEAANFIVSK